MECYNVILPKAAIDSRYPGGVARYRADCPNGTYTEDDHLARVSFMGWPEVDRFVGHLTALGLVAPGGDRPSDVAVVDTADGPIGGCDWLDWTREGAGSRCWLRGTPEGELCRVAPVDLEALLASLADEPEVVPEA